MLPVRQQKAWNWPVVANEVTEAASAAGSGRPQGEAIFLSNRDWREFLHRRLATIFPSCMRAFFDTYRLEVMAPGVGYACGAMPAALAMSSNERSRVGWS